MRSVNWLFYSGLVVFGFATGSVASAHDHDNECMHHHHGPMPTPPRTVCDAGHPFWVKDHAIHTDETHHRGYMVGGGGGGCFRQASGPCADEGTFGWDYATHFSFVNLGFNHGRRYQGGGGTYNQESSKPISTFLRSLRD